MNFRGFVQVGDVLTSAAPSMSDQVTSSGVVGFLTFTSNLIKSRINKGVTLMEIHGVFGKYDKYCYSPGTATDDKTGVMCGGGKAATSQSFTFVTKGYNDTRKLTNNSV